MSINYSAHPHIVNGVFSLADRPSLIAWRAVADEFADQADPVLVGHVTSTLTDRKADETPTVVAAFGCNDLRLQWMPHGDDPFDSDYEPSSDGEGGISEIDSEFEDSDDAMSVDEDDELSEAAQARHDFKVKTAIEIDAGLRLLEHARVLDIHGYGGMRYEEFETALQGPLSAVETLRVFDTSQLTLYTRAPHTIVFFKPIPSYVNPRTHKLVYHYTGTVDDIKTALLPDWEPTRPSRGHVEAPIGFLFMLIQGPSPGEVWKGGYRTSEKPIIEAAIELDATYNGPSELYRYSRTFVGGRKLVLSTLGLPPDATSADIAAATSAAGAPNVKFLTPEEYEAEIGPEQFAFETQADPYNGPRVVFHE
ncbi:uncharacterized protein LOC62_02G001787 [Vanrija pseudolonga]|uniref:Uncharacterized protein n=1 Tax=Vanrija pseudolonga TaxID=143232 RepID=A0AAF1BFM1_9TREE|nr:hypothetical protein LOC62_02G001787 [Vanrija pseudolonga]